MDRQDGPGKGFFSACATAAGGISFFIRNKVDKNTKRMQKKKNRLENVTMFCLVRRLNVPRKKLNIQGLVA